MTPSRWTRVRRNARELVEATWSGRQARRDLVRRHTYTALRQVVPYVGMEGRDGVVFAGTADRTVGKHVFMHGRWAGEDLPRALALAGVDLAGSVFVEVGANIGTTTLQAARLARHVLAIEPEPTNFRLLRANVAVNLLDDVVTTVNAGCSSVAAAGFMMRSGVNWGDHRVSRDGGDVQVELVRLDDAVAAAGVAVEDVGFLWIDVQGHEAAVLAGAERLLAAAPPVLVEYWPSVLGASVSALEQLVSDHYSTVIDLHTGEPTTFAAVRERLGDDATDLLCLR